MGMLDGDLATSIFDGFRGRLSVGLLRKRAVPESGGLDARGDPIDTVPTDKPIEGFYEDLDSAYMARAGLPADSVKVNIFAQSCPGVVPGRDDVVKLTRASVDHWFQLRRVQIDPAGALWVCPDAFEIPEPV